jgi:trimeric autotransporter adhesin
MSGTKGQRIDQASRRCVGWLMAVMAVSGALACVRDPRDDAATAQVAAAVALPAAIGRITPSSARIPVNVEQVFKTNLGAAAVWSVANPSIASVTTAGIATSLKVGSTKILVSAGSLSASAVLTVTTATLQAISVTETRRVGRVTQGPIAFAATGIFSDGSRLPLRGATTVWTSSDVAVATVSSDGVLTPIANGKVQITATDEATAVSGTATFTVTGLAVSAVSVAPPSMDLPQGFQGTFRATVLYGRSSGRFLTNQHSDTVVWSVSDPKVASVSDAGIVTALKTGQATIWATERSSGVVGSAVLNVTSDRRVELQVTCAQGKQLACRVPADGSLTLKAVATAITNTRRPVQLSWIPTWTSSDESIATVSSTQQPTCTPLQLKSRSASCSQETNGEVVGVSPGTVTITATDPVSGLSDSVTVVVGAALPLMKVEVNPVLSSESSGRTRASALNLPVGADQAYSATAFYGSKKAVTAKVDVTSRAAWTSSKPNNATVSNDSDSAGVVSGVSAGNATISATFGGQAGSAKVTVLAAPPRSIEVSPQTSGIPNRTTQQLTATGLYAIGPKGKSALLKFDITRNVLWTSSTVGVHVSNAVGSEGLATARQTGTAVITATDAVTGISGKAWITVTPAVLRSLTISPASLKVAVGSTLQFTARGTLSDGTRQDMTSAVLWTSTSKSVARVSNAATSAGVATAVAVGHTDIGAFDPTSGINADSTTLEVDSVTLTAITISPATVTIPDGLTQQFTATGTYNNGVTSDLTAVVIWSVTSGGATVSDAPGSEGLATTQGAGTSTIAAVEPASGLQATATLNVVAVQLVSIAIVPSSPSVVAGLTQQFLAMGTFSDGSTQDLTAAVVWDSSQPGVFGVSNADGSEGLGTAIGAGATIVSAVDPTTGVTGTTTVTVTSPALVSIAVSPADLSIAAGQTQQYTAAGTFTDGSTSDLTSTASWQSSSAAVFSFSTDPGSNGLATAGVTGTATVSATDAATGISGQATATVVSAGDAFAISVTFTPATECCAPGCGEPFSIVVVDTDANGNTIDTAGLSSGDIPSDGSVILTLPTLLPTGAAYTVSVSTSSDVYTCSVDGVSGVVSGPVTLTASCFRNNC